MELREVVKPFTAMDAYGHPQMIRKATLLHGIGDGNGFSGRIDDRSTLASFVYLGIVYYARKDAFDLSTEPMTFRSRRQTL